MTKCVPHSWTAHDPLTSSDGMKIPTLETRRRVREKGFFFFGGGGRSEYYKYKDV